MRTSNIDAKTHEPAYDAAAGSASHSSDLDVIDSPREYDPALGLERSLSRRCIQAQTTYRVYKRRFFGLAQLVLLNIIVSWDWLSFSPVSKTSAEYFETSETAINWLSTSFLFSFCVASPFTIYALNKAGPRGAIIVASCLILGGNWARYGGTRGGEFGAVMFGQILIGLAQPFVLSAPTRYSDVWFSDKGRVSATAVASLANPLGGALAQLIDPFWATETSDIPNMVLYISIIVRTLSKTHLLQPTSSNVPSVNRGMHTLLLCPLGAPNPTQCFRGFSATNSHPHEPLDPLPLHQPQTPRILARQSPPDPPLLGLRVPLQFPLLPPEPNPISLFLHRNPIWHRRRPADPRWPTLRRPLLTTD